MNPVSNLLRSEGSPNRCPADSPKTSRSFGVQIFDRRSAGSFVQHPMRSCENHGGGVQLRCRRPRITPPPQASSRSRRKDPRQRRRFPFEFDGSRGFLRRHWPKTSLHEASLAGHHEGFPISNACGEVSLFRDLRRKASLQRTVDRKPLRLEVQGETFALRNFGLPDMFNGRSTFLWQGAATDGLSGSKAAIVADERQPVADETAYRSGRLGATRRCGPRSVFSEIWRLRKKSQ